jgi:mono/diheme cytochrome c family protein
MKYMHKLLTAAAFLSFLAPMAARADASSDLVARGQYLTRAADCQACHTAPDGQPFAGGRAFVLPFGVLYSPNITPDAATGIALYSDAAWIRMLHKGIGRDGKHLYPAMPYTSYTGLSDSDALAIKAYLMSLAPVAANVPADQIRFPFDQRWGMVFWNLLYNPDTRFQPDPTQSAEYNRGAYLVEDLGHCAECHTPRNFAMALQSGKQLAGAEQGGWLAYNLTSDPTRGLGGWTDLQLEQYLSTGHADGRGPASGPMAEVVEDSLRYLTPADIHAMVVFLRAVPAQPDGPAQVQANGKPMTSQDMLGQLLFQETCEGCHLPNGDGRQSAWAALRGSQSAGDPAGTNIIQVLTHGTKIETDQGTMAMPSFTGSYTDDELAALGNYTISQFGFRQGTITAAQIHAQRDQGTDTDVKPAS